MYDMSSWKNVPFYRSISFDLLTWILQLSRINRMPDMSSWLLMQFS